VGTVGNVSGEWGKREAFFAYQSFLVPSTIYRYDVSTGARSVWAKQQIPLRGDRYEVERVRYTSRDGTEIPMFVVHRKGLVHDGSSPALLTGYGGFTLSQTPAFSARAALWVERGGVYAVANLRGGSEFGEPWHEAGMLDRKQNVFDDFVAAADWLIAKGYTSTRRLAISGGSNGGLLVGAAFTQRPGLFSAVVCSYPLLDMIRYHKFLVASYWVPEYGSSEDAAQFQYLYAYSPYHHVRPGIAYPAVLFITGDSDTRVAPLHARKMTALLQADSSDLAEKPVLLYYDTKAGHSRGINTPVAKQIEDLTTEAMFLFWQLGMLEEPAAKKAA
jgi:prolyl oligopeptidase